MRPTTSTTATYTAYVNGSMVASRVNYAPIDSVVRGIARLGSSGFVGAIDSFRVYDYALDASTASAVYGVVSTMLPSTVIVPSSSAPLPSSSVEPSSSVPVEPSSSAPVEPSTSAPVEPSSSARGYQFSGAPVTPLSSVPVAPLSSVPVEPLPSSSALVPIAPSSSAPQPTPVVDAPRALSPRHGPLSSYDAAHVRAVSRELLDRLLSLTPLGGTPVDDGLYSWTLPFAFRVDSVTTSTVTISTNGNLQFGGGMHSYRFVPEPLPKGDGELLPLLSYLFTDIKATSFAQFRVGVLGNTTNERVAILRVQAVGTASNRSAASSIDVLLFEGVNRIEVRYYSVGVFTERTLIALQNADSGDFAVFWNVEELTNDARALLSGSTIVFQPRVVLANDGGARRRLRRRLLFAMA